MGSDNVKVPKCAAFQYGKCIRAVKQVPGGVVGTGGFESEGFWDVWYYI